MKRFPSPQVLVKELNDKPMKPIFKTGFNIKLLIPDFNKNIDKYYDLSSGQNLSIFKHFGVLIEFDFPTELDVFTPDMVLNDYFKLLTKEFGPILFKNAFVPKEQRGGSQKNIFPDLVFHVDRGHHFDNQYSMFMRDPDDPEQRNPRTSSTLLTDFKVAQLQYESEGKTEYQPGISNKLFSHSLVRKAKNKVLLEQQWSAPTGVGEMCVFDNRTVVHSSFYRVDRGYKIGVRYLY